MRSGRPSPSARGLHRARARALPAARRARRLGVDAGDGVPRGDQRLERRHGEVGRSHEDEAHGRAGLGPRLLPLQLLHARGDHRALDRAQIVDEEPALQVVELVLHADGGAVGELRLVRGAVEPEPAHPHPRRAGHVLVDVRDREAALLAGDGLLRGPSELGVDEHHRLRRVVLAGDSPSPPLAASPRAGSRRARCPAPRTWWRTCPRRARAPPSSIAATGSAALRSRGSGWIRMGRIAMAAR